MCIYSRVFISTVGVLWRGEIARRVDGHERADSHLFLEGHRKRSLLSNNPELIFLNNFLHIQSNSFDMELLSLKLL